MTDDFVELAGEIGAGLGLAGAVCRLYALLYVKGRPMSLDAMAEGLGLSKGSVSVNIRTLERWGAVRKVWKKGSRRDYYSAEDDIFRVFAARMAEGMDKRIGKLRRYARGARGEDELKRLRELEKQLDMVQKALRAAAAPGFLSLPGEKSNSGFLEE